MKIEKLRLKNFRCFKDVSVTLDERLTVIVAENGQGKSTLLDAIRIGVWPFIKSFDLAKSSSFNEPSNSITVDDVRVVNFEKTGAARQLPTEIELTGAWDQIPSTTWMRSREKEERKTKTKDDANSKKISALTESIQKKIRPSEEGEFLIDLPVFGYYGTGRLWAQKKLLNKTNDAKEKLTKDEENDLRFRTFGYRNCMDPASTYKHFREWFIRAWESRTNMNTRVHVSDDEKRNADARIKVVQGVIDTFMQEATGWHTLEYSVEDQKSLILTHNIQGRMDVDYLSDGMRSMLAMVGDIAYRCVKLNPHKGASAASETSGLVLIDEVDMHLHPRWQQTVLGQLLKAFPEIQFIVTTHSPQVLTTVKPQSIRGLKTVDGNLVVKDDYEFSEGAEAQVALEDILGVPARADDLPIVKVLKQYLQLISEDKLEEAKQLRQQLDDWGRGYEPALVAADMDIRMREFRRSKVANEKTQ